MGDIGDVWNAVKDTATLFANGQTQHMPARAFACPAGVQPNQLDWSNSAQQTLRLGRSWSNRARDWFGLSTGTQIRFGCTWTYGGSSSSHPGLYLYDAYLWAVVDHASAGVDMTITGGFGDAVPYGNSAQLTAWIQIQKKQFWMEAGSWQLDITIRGNGYGVMRYV